MEDRELIELLAEALQESQWCLMEGSFPEYFTCPSCESCYFVLGDPGEHIEGCRVDRALTEFEEWKKAPYTKAVKALRGG